MYSTQKRAIQFFLAHFKFFSSTIFCFFNFGSHDVCTVQQKPCCQSLGSLRCFVIIVHKFIYYGKAGNFEICYSWNTAKYSFLIQILLLH